MEQNLIRSTLVLVLGPGPVGQRPLPKPEEVFGEGARLGVTHGSLFFHSATPDKWGLFEEVRFEGGRISVSSGDPNRIPEIAKRLLQVISMDLYPIQFDEVGFTGEFEILPLPKVGNVWIAETFFKKEAFPGVLLGCDRIAVDLGWEDGTAAHVCFEPRANVPNGLFAQVTKPQPLEGKNLDNIGDKLISFLQKDAIAIFEKFFPQANEVAQIL